MVYYSTLHYLFTHTFSFTLTHTIFIPTLYLPFTSYPHPHNQRYNSGSQRDNLGLTHTVAPGLFKRLPDAQFSLSRLISISFIHVVNNFSNFCSSNARVRTYAHGLSISVT